MYADRTFRGGCRSEAIDAHRTRGLDEKTNESTIEPAHEALLRQWGSLEGWLAEDFGMLAILEGLKRASRD
jgi:protein tyrosine/serine phosphatase